MPENDNIQRLNQISSAVTERDMKIWENVAYSACIKKQTEKLESETVRIKAATAEKKKENQMLEEQLVELTKTLSIQRDTLKCSERSVIMQKSFKETLLQENNEFKKKYAQTLEMYNDELQDYRAIYENASQSYKDLKAQRIDLKKLKIKKMIFEANILSLLRHQEQYEKIQEMIFHKTMVKLAEGYLLYQKREKVRLQVQEKKKEEQQLLKEHLQLAEAVKQKKMLQNRAKPSVRENSAPTQEPSKKTKETTTDKLQKFLNEEIQPCSLTSFNLSQKSERNKPKVNILDVQMIKPRLNPAKKANLDLKLRKKMEEAMQAAKKEARRSNSFQIDSKSSQQKHKIATPSGSQIGSQKKKPTPPASQEKEAPPPKIAKLTPEPKIPILPEKPILKPSSQTSEADKDKPENISKFFNLKKKSVTFQNVKETPLEAPSRFQLFAREEKKKSDSGTIVKNMDIFKKSFLFKDVKKEEKNKKEVVLESEVETSEAESGSVTVETGRTFSTFGGESGDKKHEAIFSLLDNSFNRGQSSLSTCENFASGAESTTYNFFGSQNQNNPFGFI